MTVATEKSVGVSMGYPYLCHDAMAGANTFLNIYSTNPEAQKAFVKAYQTVQPYQNNNKIKLKRL